MKVSLCVAASMDGSIARKDGSIDWLGRIGGETDFGYQDFYRAVDALCMGNRTYQQIAAAPAFDQAAFRGDARKANRTKGQGTPWKSGLYTTTILRLRF